MLPHPLPDDLVELIARRFRVHRRADADQAARPAPRGRGDRRRADRGARRLAAERLQAPAVLADAGILGRRKDGNHVYYRIVDEGVFALCEEVCGSVQRSCAAERARRGAAGDRRRRGRRAARGRASSRTVGPLGRLGRWTADHVRAVAIAWVVVAVALGVFAPQGRDGALRRGLAGERLASRSQARDLIQANFAGLSSSALMVVVHSTAQTVGDAALPPTVARVERDSPRRTPEVASVQPPHAGSSISPRRPHRDRHRPAPKGDPTAMVAAADTLKRKLTAAGGDGVSVSLTGASGHVERLQHRQPQRDDEVRALLLAGDAGDPRARLRLARRRRAAADADDPRPRRLGRAARLAHARSSRSRSGR